MRLPLAAAMLAAATPVFADTTSGTVVAFDRKANVVVMDDKTIWQLAEKTAVTEELEAGDAVRITFTSLGDDGIASVDAVEKL